MKKISIFAFIAALMFSTSCSKSELLLFDTTYNYVQFSSEDEDDEAEDEVSFSMLPGSTEITYEIDIEILGDSFKEATAFKVSVVDSLTTAVAGLHYVALDEYYLFPAGVFESTLPITFMSTEDMDAEMFYLQLQIEELGNVKPGMVNMTSRTIGVTNMLVQPSWWPSYVYTGIFVELLGAYTAAKWENLIAALTEAGYDVPNTDFDNFAYGDWYDVTLILSQYLEENQPVDSNGNLVTIPFPY